MGVQEIRDSGYGPAGASGRVGAGAQRAGRPVLVEEDESGARRTRRAGFGGIRLRVRSGLVPDSTGGKVFGGVLVVVALAGLAGLGLAGWKALLRDERFTIPSSASIQIQGNSHLSRAQLLSVFGEDVERNVLGISLAERRAELERLPWVEHATVMRLLPNKLRVSVVERTPVAFVRQGRHVGLVDGNGVLLDIGDGGAAGYSFPVVTGINAEDPLSVRAARMKIFRRFASELDGAGERITSKLSEVDLSNPEDVKALIPDGSSDLLVHFGDAEFLERYRKFEEQLPVWREQYPKLASADMRYERQVVLEMQAGVAVPVAEGAAEAAVVKKPVVASSSKTVGARQVAQVHPEHFVGVKVKAVAPHGLSSKALSEMGQPHYPAGAGAVGKE